VRVEFVAFALFVGYLIPWIAAVARDHERHGVVLAVSLLLGWTIVGWLGALAYALASDPHPGARRRARRRPPLRLVVGGAAGAETGPGPR
jgi:hypothetical protein